MLYHYYWHIISLLRHGQVRLTRQRFERYFDHDVSLKYQKYLLKLTLCVRERTCKNKTKYGSLQHL